MLESMKKVDKKMLTMMGVVVGIVLVIVVLILVVSLTTGGKLSYSKIEDKMVSAAKSYYKDNSGSLPEKLGETVEIDTSTLTSNGYLKELSEMAKDDAVCSGKVIVRKMKDDYDYVASLDCGDKYKTEFLADKLIEDTVTSGNGLYKLEDFVTVGNTPGIDEEGYDLSSNELMKGYVYRGQEVNNYIKLDDVLYRIVKIDGNNDFTVVTTKKKANGPYDDRYNSEIQKQYGINDYSMSRAHERLDEIYASLSKDGQIMKKLVPKNVCIGGRDAEDSSTDGSSECSKVMKNQYYSLLPLFDIMNASLSTECTTSISKECGNYNYLIGDMNYWSMTPSNENTYTGYKITSDISSSRVVNSSNYRYAYYLSGNLIYVEGTGTESDPYIVK